MMWAKTQEKRQKHALRLSHSYGAGRLRLEGGARPHKTAPDEAFIRATLKNYQALGFDFLRDGGDRWGAGEFAAKIAGEYGICYRTPCFPIYKRGHYGSFIGRGYETLDEFRALVREVKERGGHFIKIMISGLMDFNHYGILTDTPMPADEVAAITDIAHEAGFAVMAHANGDAAVSAAIAAGSTPSNMGRISQRRRCTSSQRMPDRSGFQHWRQSAIWSAKGASGRGREASAGLSGGRRRQGGGAGRISCAGSDAGAWAVPHGKGGLDEQHWLREALGSDADAVLERGAAEIRKRF